MDLHTRLMFTFFRLSLHCRPVYIPFKLYRVNYLKLLVRFFSSFYFLLFFSCQCVYANLFSNKSNVFLSPLKSETEIEREIRREKNINNKILIIKTTPYLNLKCRLSCMYTCLSVQCSIVSIS